MIIAFVISLLSVQQAPSSIHAGDDGGSLYRSCVAAIRTFDNPTSTNQADVAESHSCYAYIQGFIDGSNIDGTSFCTSGATIGTGIRIYVAYMQKSPKRFDDYKAEGVFRAFREAYPCATKPK